MVIFGKSQHKKSSFSGWAFNQQLFRKNLKSLVSGANSDVLLAISKESQIRGMLIAWFEPLLWNHKYFATDLHFVAEQGGDMLLREFKKWAKKRNCCEIGMGTFNGKEEDRVEKLFNRLGFESMGTTYRVELFG